MHTLFRLPVNAASLADGLWRYPTGEGRGGYVFMHSGDNMIRYPDHGPHMFGLVSHICARLAGRSVVDVPERQEPAPVLATLVGSNSSVANAIAKNP